MLVLGCERASTTPTVARTPTPLDPATTGTIEGRVLFDGTTPAPRTITVSSDPICAAAHPDGLRVADVRADDGRLADAFVYVASGLADRVFAIPATPVVIDQHGCWYEPRVAGVEVGQTVVFRSSDDTLHNVHGEPRDNPRWNFGLARRNAERTLTFGAPEAMIPVRCDVHPWMRLDLGVLPHPYFAVTGTDGAFRLDGVPAGSYTVAAWHATLGRREETVTVTPHATVAVTFRFTLP